MGQALTAVVLFARLAVEALPLLVKPLFVIPLVAG